MTESEIPQLHLSRDHIMAMTQVLTMLSQRLAEQRERRGRAAYSDAEHAARIADTHDNPVLRPMTAAERHLFTAQAGDPQAPQHGLTVATAPVGQEWGVRAVEPTGDYTTVMCPTISDAARLADYLRAQNSPAAVNELNELSEQIGHRVAADNTATAQPAAGRASTPLRETSGQPRLAQLATDLPSSVTTAPEWEPLRRERGGRPVRPRHRRRSRQHLPRTTHRRHRRPQPSNRCGSRSTRPTTTRERRSAHRGKRRPHPARRRDARRPGWRRRPRPRRNRHRGRRRSRRTPRPRVPSRQRSRTRPRRQGHRPVDPQPDNHYDRHQGGAAPRHPHESACTGPDPDPDPRAWPLNTPTRRTVRSRGAGVSNAPILSHISGDRSTIARNACSTSAVRS